MNPPLTCNVPLVDAVLLHAEKGDVIPLANYTLEPLERVEFSLRTNRPVSHIETVHQGVIDFKNDQEGIVRFSIPLDATDYIKIEYK